MGHAVGWGDINDDGLLELAFSNQDGTGFGLYRNDSTEFIDITTSAGSFGISADKIIFADISGDYYPELLLTTRSGDARIFLNNQDETFTNITGNSGVSGHIYAAADFNNDGNLDIFSLTSSGSIVFTNNGDMTFTSNNIAPVASSFFCAVSCLDYNNDNYTDIYISNDGSTTSHLLKNNGDLTFTDVTNDAGVAYNGDKT